MLLFSSNHSALAVDNAPYPPFGRGAVWFPPIASYLLLVGVYSSALSVARDTELRPVIRKSVEGQSALLHSIGASEMEREIQKNVMSVTNRLSLDTEEQRDIKSSLEEKDIKQYNDEVIQEVKQKKEK
jgi:hypothetical protein